MRLVSWNIQQGGGARMDGIIAALNGWAPDILTLQEVRIGSLSKLCPALAQMGLTYSHIEEPKKPSQNTLLIASRAPLDGGPFLPKTEDRCHILEAEVAGCTILPVHFPQKAAQVPLFDALLNDSESLLPLNSLIIGDLNCGIPFEDSSEKTFANTHHFQALKSAGWIDLYRTRHGPDARDFTWISPRTGRGFRYDHALASPAFDRVVTEFRYDHSVRTQHLSDHSAILLDMNQAALVATNQ